MAMARSETLDNQPDISAERQNQLEQRLSRDYRKVRRNIATRIKSRSRLAGGLVSGIADDEGEERQPNNPASATSKKPGGQAMQMQSAETVADELNKGVEARQKQLEYGRQLAQLARVAGGITGKGYLGAAADALDGGIDQYGGEYKKGGKKGVAKQAAMMAGKRKARSYLQNSRGMGAMKTGATIGAGSSLAQGDVRGAGESATAGALKAKKMQKLKAAGKAVGKQLKAGVQAVKAGKSFKTALSISRLVAGISIVGIIIVVVIWLIQLVIGHWMGHEMWKMSKIEYLFVTRVLLPALAIAAILVFCMFMASLYMPSLIGMVIEKITGQ